MARPAPVIAYVALGANLGDREANIGDALRRLEQDGRVRVRRVSSLLENPAIGGPPGSPPFLNAVAEIETELDPEELLDRLLDVEKQLGRVRRLRWEPRIIDLDLLLYGNEVLETPRLSVPHPLMQERLFVLRPLAEIAPEVLHPVLDQTAASLLRQLEARGST